MSASREQLLLETITLAADTLVGDFDAVEFLHDLTERCATICDAVDVGIVLTNTWNQLVVMASNTHRVRAVEALQLSAGHGPCVDAFAFGDVVTAGSFEEIARRWPALAQGVTDAGYRSVHAVPLRLRGTRIGSLNFFRDSGGYLSESDVGAAQTIADIATIGLMQERIFRDATATRRQLQHALHSRILIEQAKGVIAHSRNVDMDQAWRILRTRARSRQARVTDIAQAVIDRLIVL